MQHSQHRWSKITGLGVCLVLLSLLLLAMPADFASAFMQPPASKAAPAAAVNSAGGMVALSRLTPAASRAALANGTIYLPIVMQPVTGGLAAPRVTHAGSMFEYKNGATCATCHPADAADAMHSNHYQWDGKLGALNDFCEYPDINFIGLLTNLDQNVVPGGCATCHAGMGKKPTDPTAGVENVDCMMCHSPEYTRKVVKNAAGKFEFQPNPVNMTVIPPGRAECLRCHAYSGGGDNNKRGDMSSTLVNPPVTLDVHMGSGMICTDCHTTLDHKIAGRGVDLIIRENVPMKDCTECHTTAPHINPNLNRHTAKVACQSCHIPEYARSVSTDMLRDYRTAEVNPRRLYEPTIIRGANVIPSYGFWNGESTFYQFMAPAVSGQVMAKPLGGINDPGSKLYPFKVHQAKLPHDPVSGVILPVKSGILFQTGNVFNAIMAASQELGIALPNGYDFIDVTRVMGIYHEMPSADQALSCDTCHNGSRINFAQLGYSPVTTRNNKPLCESCHEPKSNWNASEFFVRVHDKHVRSEGYTCSTCHTFSR